MAEDPRSQFANFEWQSRWNDSKQIAMLHQSGSQIIVTGFFGTLHSDLVKTDDIAAIIKHARGFADMLEKTKREYDEEIAKWS